MRVDLTPGIDGARISKALDGRWVYTTVLMRPIRAANHDETTARLLRGVP
jgi:hypothetical protein